MTVRANALIASSNPTFRDITFNAADFTANGAMTYTVIAGNVLANRFAIYSNNIMEWFFRVANGTVGGVLDTELRITLPDSWLVAQRTMQSNTGNSFGLASEGVRFIFNAGAAFVAIFRENQAVNWTAGAAVVEGQFRVEVTK